MRKIFRETVAIFDLYLFLNVSKKISDEFRLTGGEKNVKIITLPDMRAFCPGERCILF